MNGKNKHKDVSISSTSSSSSSEGRHHHQTKKQCLSRETTSNSHRHETKLSEELENIIGPCRPLPSDCKKVFLVGEARGFTHSEALLKMGFEVCATWYTFAKNWEQQNNDYFELYQSTKEAFAESRGIPTKSIKFNVMSNVNATKLDKIDSVDLSLHDCVWFQCPCSLSGKKETNRLIVNFFKSLDRVIKKKQPQMVCIGITYNKKFFTDYNIPKVINCSESYRFCGYDKNIQSKLVENGYKHTCNVKSIDIEDSIKNELVLLQWQKRT